MQSKPYKLGKRTFRYDYDSCIVELISKASDEDLQMEADWKAKYKSSLFDIDDMGYMVLNGVGLRKENWDNKSIRDEYLSEWNSELDEEDAYLLAEAKAEFGY